MTVREHYDNHLSNFYSWMAGDFESKEKEFRNFLEDKGIVPSSTKKKAIDLGAGHGLQSVPLAKLGFKVTAVDFNAQLLAELRKNAEGLHIETLNDDIKHIRAFAGEEVELIVCCGDTLSHLDNKREIKALLIDISTTLSKGGKAVFNFRDYSTELTGDKRFIPVKADDTRILTCVLEYEREAVIVTDLLYERTEMGWQQKVSSYKKVRISIKDVIEVLEGNGMQIELNQVINGMITMVAVKL